MKVIEIAEITKKSVEYLLQVLEDNDVILPKGAETNLDSKIEANLAKLLKVSYPFKKDGAKKDTNKPTVVSIKTKTESKPVEKPKEVKKDTIKVITKRTQVEEMNAQKKENKPQEQKPVEQKPQQVNNQPKPVQQNNQQKPQQQKPQQNNNHNNQQKPQQNNQQKPQQNKPVEQKPAQQSRPHPTSRYDEEVKPRVDESILNKYGDFLEDEEYNSKGHNNNKGKQQNKKQNEYSNKDNRQGNNKHNKNQQKPVQQAKPKKEVAPKEKILYWEPAMTIAEIAEAMDLATTELVKKMFVSMGIMAQSNQTIDRDTAELICLEYEYEIKNKEITDFARFDEMEIVDDEKDLRPRPSIVTIMGHVDHGKTTLLDYIRKSHVTNGEFGGITQHIGAYQVEVNGELITFIDTPGHAAFTEMRARGAQITDIVILVVAADDGVMPQTIEAIEHAKAAGVPIIVAINKMDKPDANPDRIKQELLNYGLLAEEWGGDTIFVPISAKKGDGVKDLLEMVILVSQMKELKANPSRDAIGTVIEAKLDEGRGPVATLLVQNGTLKVGDILVVGNTFGKIRAMNDENKKLVKEAKPSKPVEITGLDEVPSAGEKFMVVKDKKVAAKAAEVRSYNKFAQEMGIGKTVSLNELFNNQPEGDVKNLNLIIKCDVQGSIEAIKGLLDKIEIEGTKINIVASRVGGITETDINLAIASKAIIIGFNIRPTAQINDLAKDKGIEIRLYNIIYKLQEDIEAAVKGMLDPVFEEKNTGEAEVREVYKISKVGTVAGSYVTSGQIVRNGGVRIVRDSIVIYTGKIGSLKRFKDDAKEVKAGFECGITVENFNDIKVGDIFECFIMEEVEQ